MKDAHLFAALDAAVRRFGTSEFPDDATADASRFPRLAGRGRRRSPGWVSIREIEACQPPNTYPRFGRRVIKVRCAQLAREEEGPILEMRLAGLRTWVRFAPPRPAAPDDDEVPERAATDPEAWVEGDAAGIAATAP